MIWALTLSIICNLWLFGCVVYYASKIATFKKIARSWASASGVSHLGRLCEIIDEVDKL